MTDNLLGIHALVWTGSWDEGAARRAIAASKAAGYDLIEIPILDPYGIDTKMTRALLAEHGLRAACSLGLPADADVSSEDPAVVARGRALLARAVQVCEEVGGEWLGGVLFSQLTKYPEPCSERSRAHVVAALSELAAVGRSAGIKVYIVVVNRYETNVINTGAQALALLDEAGVGDAIGVHLDTYHMNIEEDGFAAPLELVGDRLGYFHIGESHRGYLGTGTIDFDAAFAALRDSSYDGPVVFESFSSEVVHPELSNDLAVWRNLWSDGADLARHAREFMARRLG